MSRRTAAGTVVEFYKSSTNRRLSSATMSNVPRIGEIVTIESRGVAMKVEDVIWDAERDLARLYLAPDRERLDRSPD